MGFVQFLALVKFGGVADVKKNGWLQETSSSQLQARPGILSKLFPLSLSCVCLTIIGSNVCSADPLKLEPAATTTTSTPVSTNKTSLVADNVMSASSTNLITSATLKLNYSKPPSALSQAVEAKYQYLASKSLERHQVSDGRISSLMRKFATSDGQATWANLEAGYGKLFPRDSQLVKGRNGTAYEEKGNIYVKYSRAF